MRHVQFDHAGGARADAAVRPDDGWQAPYELALAEVALQAGRRILHVGSPAGISARAIATDPRCEEWTLVGTEPVDLTAHPGRAPGVRGHLMIGDWVGVLRMLASRRFTAVVLDDARLGSSRLTPDGWFELVTEAHRLLGPAGVLTYALHETEQPADHVERLLRIGFRVEVRECAVAPPPGDRWTATTALVPVARKGIGETVLRRSGSLGVVAEHR